MKRRGATTLAGILAIDKPAGVTSHDVVAAVRRATGEGRVGHAGTLDPAATGLLVVLIGPYTRLEPYLSGASKTYEARIRFGTETDTDDAEGAVTRTAPAPESLFELDRARECVQDLCGTSLQVPPAYSAIKVSGRVAHREARSGRPMVLAARPVAVHEATLLGIDAGARTWDVSLCVSKGTYVRAVARDLGRACGSAAHLAALRRTASGHLTLDAAHSPDEVARAAQEGRIETLFVDEVAALGLPSVAATSATVGAGGPLACPAEATLTQGSLVAVTVDRRLAGVYRVRDDALVAEVVVGGRAGE